MMKMKAGGFTLVEMLIAITMTGVLGAAMFSLVMGQARFYGHSSDAIHAQASLRNGLDFLASELRMASPSDLLYATADSVAIRYDIVRGIVCDTTAADEVTVFVYDTVPPVDLPAFRGTGYSGPYDSAFALGDNWTPTTSQTGAAPEADCTALGAPGGHPGNFYRRLTGWTGRFGDVPDRGAVVRWYGRLDYRILPATAGVGTAIWRVNQELVAPFAEAAQFRYVMADASVQNNVLFTDLPDVREVRIIIAARGEGTNRYGVQRPFRFDMPLRN